MVDFKWIQISLFLIAVLQFPAAAEGLRSSFTVRAGQEVTLPCENVIDDQQNCNSTTWVYMEPRKTEAVQLIRLGQIAEHGKSKSDRLSVTQNCSLVIKKVTHEDAGRYYCQQWKSGQRPGYLYVVYLAVVTMTEHKNTDQVELSCSVSPYGWCYYTVKWLYVGHNVDEDHTDLQTLQSVCSASVRLQSSHLIHTSNSDLLKCEVTDENKVQQLFPFRLQPSGEGGEGWWRFIIVSVGLAALVIIVVAVNMWRRTKGRKTQTDENVVAGDEDDGAANYENVTSSV